MRLGTLQLDTGVDPQCLVRSEERPTESAVRAMAC